MIEEGGDVSAFESFTLDDAGGEKSAPNEAPKHEAAESTEAQDSGSDTTPPAGKGVSKDSVPEPQESESTGGRLQTSLDRMPKGKSGGAAATAAASATAAPAEALYEDIPASSMRKTIANRLRESMNQNPHYFVSATLSVTKLLKLRQALNASADGKYKLSVNDFLIKACAIACLKVPTVNSSWREINGQTVIRQHKTVDVSVAVATPIGLMTPIVKNADSIGLSSISSSVKDLGKRARDGKLKPEEYQGGTFTISNMGMNAAVERFTAVINPPQAGILAVGTVRKVPVPIETEEGTSMEWDDQIVVTGSFDHKVVDGAVGGEWIRELKKVVENPLEMML
jgi:pyruvate dehydrogenase E2 component (dihydrolipoamide acetyltransferase)